MDCKHLPPRTLILTLPSMTIEQAESLIDFVGSLSDALWAEYGEAMIDLELLRDPDSQDSDSEPPLPDDLPF